MANVCVTTPHLQCGRYPQATSIYHMYQSRESSFTAEQQ